MRKIGLLLIMLIVASACNSHPPDTAVIQSVHTYLKFHDAEKQGYVVAGPAGLANIDKLVKFYEDYKDKQPSSFMMARYTDEGDPIYVDLDYDGITISYTYDNTWDGHGGQYKGVQRASCTQMDKRTGPRGERYGTEYFLASCKEDIGYSDEENEQYFILFVEEDK